MSVLNNEDFGALKAAVAAVTPPGWRYTLRQDAGTVRMEVQRAPVDLLAADAALCGPNDKPYRCIVPTAYEGNQASPIGAIWQALHSMNTVEFDGQGERVGRWYAVELWIGHWKRPFQVSQ